MGQTIRVPLAALKPETPQPASTLTVPVAQLQTEAAPQPAGADLALTKATGIGPDPTAQLRELTRTMTPAEMFKSPEVADLMKRVDRLKAVHGAEILPTIVGWIGGMFGGATGSAPGAIAGAGVGGAVGEAARQVVLRDVGVTNGVPQTAGGQLVAMGKEGVTQAALEGGGRALAAGAKVMGRSMVENAVRPPIAMQREFPEVLDTIVKEQLPVGAGVLDKKKGSQLALDKLGEWSASVKALLERKTKEGLTFEASKISTPVLQLIDDIAKQPLGDAQMKQLTGMLDEFLARHQGPITPVQVQELKRAAQAIAKPIYKAEQRGAAVTADQTLLARFNEAIAHGAKQAMETIPGIAEGEARKRALIGAHRALSQAEQRRMSLMAEGVTGAAGIVGSLVGPEGGLEDSFKRGVVSWGVARGMMSPRVISRVGLQLTKPQLQALFQQFPRLAAEVISRAQAGEQSPTAATAGR